MDNTSKRTFTLELTNEDAKAFFEKCYLDETTPAEVLEGFINDLIDGCRTRGSDERLFAKQYYSRCGYGVFLTGDTSFSRFLLRKYGDCALYEIRDSLDVLTCAQEDISFYREHPEEDPGEGFLEDLGDTVKEEEEVIGTYYQEYSCFMEKRHKSPETLKDGIEGVRDYLETIESIMEGGNL